MSAPFILDLESNPHPTLKRMARKAYDDARVEWEAGRYGTPFAYWQGFRDAMMAATGCDMDDIVAWVARP